MVTGKMIISKEKEVIKKLLLLKIKIMLYKPSLVFIKMVSETEKVAKKLNMDHLK